MAVLKQTPRTFGFIICMGLKFNLVIAKSNSRANDEERTPALGLGIFTHRFHNSLLKSKEAKWVGCGPGFKSATCPIAIP